MTKGYTTKEAIENYMLIDISDSFNNQIAEWIEGIEDYLDHETGRDFSLAEDADEATDRTYDGDLSKTINIDPAVEITEVRFSQTGDPIDADQYVLYPIRKATTTSIRLKNYNFPKGVQNIYVKAKWGYDKVPADIKLAATVLVAGIINNAWTDGEAKVSSETIGRYTVTYKTKSQETDFDRVADIIAFNKKYTF
jgi:hypothetical protein